MADAPQPSVTQGPWILSAVLLTAFLFLVVVGVVTVLVPELSDDAEEAETSDETSAPSPAAPQGDRRDP